MCVAVILDALIEWVGAVQVYFFVYHRWLISGEYTPNCALHRVSEGGVSVLTKTINVFTWKCCCDAEELVS